MNRDQLLNYMQQVNNIIERVGYAIQGVFPVNEGEITVCYTMGLTDKLGYEVIVGAPASTQTLYAMLRGITDDIISNELSLDDNVFTWGTLTNGTPLRCKFVDMTDNQEVQNFVSIRPSTVTKIYQLYIADANNILPGEPGYDDTFNQTI